MKDSAIIPEREKAFVSYQEAYTRFGTFLDNLYRPQVTKSHLKSRTYQVQRHLEEDGPGSIYSEFRVPFILGYPLLTNTLNQLARAGVRTTEDLMEFDPDSATLAMRNFGTQKAELVFLMQDVVASKIAFTQSPKQ